jgi:hypothetical protein
VPALVLLLLLFPSILCPVFVCCGLSSLPLFCLCGPCLWCERLVPAAF